LGVYKLFRDEIPPVALSDLTVKSKKPSSKPYKLADEKGLFLLIHPKSFKY